MEKVLRLPKNDKGRDLIVGDLHGCYDELWILLKHINYDPKVDRLLFVGDLIDRGAESEKCLDLVMMEGNYSVLGNHEDMMFQGVLERNWNQLDLWYVNGGRWARKLVDDYRLAVEAKLEILRPKFPIVIVVGEGADRFNIVHAEFYSYQRPLCDANIDNWDFTPEEENNMIWGRTVVNYFGRSDMLFQFNMSPTYCGHTPLRSVIAVQSQIFIDTGCVYAVMTPGRNTDTGLTIVSHQDKKYWTLHPSDNNRISHYDLPPIED
jgi:serine/threonine protein phosphatase 1